MNLEDIVLTEPILFLILGSIIIFNLICIVYLVVKERKQKDEQDIISTLVTPPEETENEKLELGEVLEEMQKNLEASPEEAVSNFEQEQEENSIISYQELVDALKSEEPVVEEMKENFKKEFTESDEALKEQLKETIQTIETNKQTKPKEEKKVFKPSEFISPIFGKISNRSELQKKNKMELEFSKDDSKERMNQVFSLDEKDTKNEEFLSALKEFRKNLE